MIPLLNVVTRILAARSQRQQLTTRLRNPEHWGASINEEGHLSFDGSDLAELVRNHGSPLMSVSRARLLADAARFRSAVNSSFPNSEVAFSYKTNCIPGVLQELHDAGFAAEVISQYELWLADKLRVPGDRIFVNGVNKDYEFLTDAVRLDVASVNVDEPGEIEILRSACRRLGKKVRVSLRLKVDRSSHFGVRIEDGEADRVAQEIARHPEHLEFVGLHFHELADNADPVPHIGYVLKALAYAAHIRRKFDLPLHNLNIGGGYTVPTMKVMSRFEYARQRLFGVPASPPDPGVATNIERYMQQMSEAIGLYCRNHNLSQPRMIFEPGRIVTSQSHVLLTIVHSIKSNQEGPNFAMTDAGKILTSYPCDYEYHQMFVANRMRAPLDDTYQLMGRLCTSADWLAKHRSMARLERGDVIAIMDAGAYFTSYASNFAFPRPKVVLLDAGKIRTLRQRETFEHLTAMDSVDLH